MANTLLHTVFTPHPKSTSNKVLLGLSLAFLCIVCLTVFQDFVASLRNGHAFYLSESLLFKTIWFLFIPILARLYSVLKTQNVDGFNKTVLFIIVPSTIHFVLLILVFTILSFFFYSGRYDVSKIVMYTLAHDFYKLVLIYSGFVLGFKYLSKTLAVSKVIHKNMSGEHIVINSGKGNTIVNKNDIVVITSATPYISIQLEDKKYLHTETLKSIGKQLDNTVFIRIHKSTIVNIRHVVSYTSRLNGDYDVLLKNGLQTRLSRTYAAAFKNVFATGHPLTT